MPRQEVITTMTIKTIRLELIGIKHIERKEYVFDYCVTVTDVWYIPLKTL